MRGTAEPWVFALSVHPIERLPGLSGVPTFEELTRRIAGELHVLCCHKSTIGASEFRRPIYTVDIGKEQFDAFFNSARGYRAAYFQSPGIGLDANVHFLAAIAEKLTSDPLSAASSLSADFINQSLRTPSAKAWLAEHGKEVDSKCRTCKGEWSSRASGPPELAEITNGRWENADGIKAEWGRKAPYLTKLRVMGAFLDDRHNELVPHDKRMRAYDIFEYGWS